MSPWCRRVLAVVLLAVAWIAGAPRAVAEEPPGTRAPIQALLLPMPTFWRQLATGDAHRLLPLAEYEAAVRAAATATSLPPAWIGDAQLQVLVTTDRRLALAGVLRIVAPAGTSADAPSPCVVFPDPPPFLGAATLDGAPALWVAGTAPPGAPAPLVLVVPTPGDHRLVLTCGSASQEPGMPLELPLPPSGSAQLTLRTAEPGLVTCPDLQQVADGSYRLLRPIPRLRIGWEPGRSDGDRSVLGIQQRVEVAIQPGRRPATWTGTLEVPSGPRPTSLLLTLPAGWIPLGPRAGAGAVTVLDPLPGDPHVRVRLALSADAMAGFAALLEPDAAIALPEVAGTLWQQGEVQLQLHAACDYTPPSTWDRLPTPQGTTRFAVPRPDDGLQVRLIDPPASASCDQTAWALLGPDRWQLDQQLILHPPAGVFSLRLRLPPAWTVVALHAPFAAHVPDLARVAPGSVVELAVPHGSQAGERWELTLRCERPALPQAALTLATVPGMTEGHIRLVVAAAAGLALAVDAPAPWQRALPGEVTPAPVPPGSDRLVDLVAAGAVPDLPVRVTPVAPQLAGTAVLQLLPTTTDTWFRLDLGMAASGGQVQDLQLTLPGCMGEVQVSAPWSVTRDGDGLLRVRVPQAWIGRRQVRLEGRLQGSDGPWPSLAVAAVPTTSAPAVAAALETFIVVSQPPEAEIAVETGARAQPVDADRLPEGWSPFPGTSLLGAYHLLPPSLDVPGPASTPGRSVAPAAATGRLRLVAHRPAPLPAGFVDGLTLRTQITGDHAVSVVRGILAVPGLTQLHLQLAAGQHLWAATIDGLPAPVRHDADGLLLSLPGRTQVQLALLLVQAVDPRRPEIAPPSFGALPVTRTAWQVAVAGPVRVVGAGDASAMPLSRVQDGPQRRWWSGWEQPPAWDEEEAVQASAPTAQDPRHLEARPAAEGAGPSPLAHGEPTLTLHGQRLVGARTGSGSLRLQVARLPDHQLAFLSGALLGILGGAWLGWRRPRVGRVAVLTAACVVITWLLTTDAGAGGMPEDVVAGAAPWGGLCLVLGASARWCWRRTSLPRTPLVGLLVGMCLLARPAAAEDQPPELVLMGYDHLDPQHRPQGVIVALTPAQDHALRGGAAPGIAGAGVACGPAEQRLRLGEDHCEGTWAIPVVVLAHGWQELHLPLGTATVAGVSPERLRAEGPPPKLATIAWSVQSSPEGGGAELVVRLRDPQELRLVVHLDWRTPLGRSGLTLRVPPAAGGGTLTVEAPAGWDLQEGQRLLPPIAGAAAPGPAAVRTWILSLPGPGSSVVLAAAPAQGAPHADQLVADHQLVVGMHPGGLHWQDQLQLSVRGMEPLAGVQVHLPPGLRILTVGGEGIGGWWQQGAVLAVRWSPPRPAATAVTLTGLLPSRWDAPGEHRTAVLPAIAGAREHGRLALVNGSEARFDAPPGCERVDTRAGEDVAVAWSDATPAEAGIVAWTAVSRGGLRLRSRTAVILGEDRVRAYVHLELSGDGRCEHLRLALPAPWMVSERPDAAAATVTLEPGTNPAALAAVVVPDTPRVLVLRATAAFAAAATLDIALERPLPTDADGFRTPDLRPVGEGQPLLERQQLVVGDAGDPRLVPRGAGMEETLEDAARVLPPPQAVLRLRERWRFARESASAPPLALQAVHDPAIIELTAEEFVRLDGRGLRRASRITATPRQGAISDLRLRLGGGQQLDAVSAPDLGWWRVEGQDLLLHLARASTAPVAISLTLHQPWSGDALVLTGFESPDELPFLRQEVNIAIADDGSLVHFAPDGLEREETAVVPPAVPVGIAPDLIDARFHAVRSGWHLACQRAAVVEAAGEDGIAALVELRTVVARDGESRSQARWRITNRTRRSLPLQSPPGTELWEVRVEGEPVRLRRDDHEADVVWVPVPLARPGHGAIEVTLVWRQGASPTSGQMVTLTAPRFRDLHVVTTLWRVSADAGLQLRWLGGGLQPCPAEELTVTRARATIDDLAQLRAADALSPAALARTRDALGRIASDLDDEITDLGHQEGAAPPVLDELRHHRHLVEEDLGRLERQGLLAARRRAQLGFARESLTWGEGSSWGPVDGSASPWAEVPMPPPPPTGWTQAATSPPADLGPGVPPPGLSAVTEGPVTGIAFVPPEEAGAATLSCRGQGADLRCRIRIEPTAAAEGRRWLAAVVGGLVLVGAALGWRRAAARG